MTDIPELYNMTECEICECIINHHKLLDHYSGKLLHGVAPGFPHTLLSQIIQLYGPSTIATGIFKICTNDDLMGILCLMLSLKCFQPQELSHILYGIVSGTITDPIDKLHQVIHFEGYSQELSRKLITALYDKILYIKPHIINEDVSDDDDLIQKLRCINDKQKELMENNEIQLKEFMDAVDHERYMKEFKELQGYVTSLNELRNSDPSFEESVLTRFAIVQKVYKRCLSGPLGNEYQQLFDVCK